MKTYLVMDEILRHCRRYIGQEYDEPYLVSAVPEEVIRSLPPADVVEVVRCGECIRKDICRTSNVWAVPPDDNWFCADGKRKKEGRTRR